MRHHVHMLGRKRGERHTGTILEALAVRCNARPPGTVAQDSPGG